MTKKDVRTEVAGLGCSEVFTISIATAAMAQDAALYEASDLIVGTLDKYEDEIIRLQEVTARLRQKNRNYRTGIKALQRAHEASLHRETVLQKTFFQNTFADAFGAAPRAETQKILAEGPYSEVLYHDNEFRSVPAQSSR